MKTHLLSMMVAATIVASSLQASNFSIPWHTVDGGGGTSTSNDGRYSVSGTAGQPDAGVLLSSDGQWQVYGGFWFPEAICDCRLDIQRSGSMVVVTWPATFRGCALETATELLSPPGRTAWTPVNATLVGDIYTYITPAAGDAQKFFRLIGL
jgi:hypothetical protein